MHNPIFTDANLIIAGSVLTQQTFAYAVQIGAKPGKQLLPLIRPRLLLVGSEVIGHAAGFIAKRRRVIVFFLLDIAGQPERLSRNSIRPSFAAASSFSPLRAVSC